MSRLIAKRSNKSTVRSLTGWLLFMPIALSALPVPPKAASGGVVKKNQPARADLSLGSLSDYRKPTPGRTQHSVALAHYATALQLEASGKVREALQHYLDAVTADPAHPELASHAAELALSYLGRDKAVEILENCVKTSPDSPVAAVQLANFFATYPPDRPGAPDRTLQVLKSALARFPGSAEVYRAAAMIFLTRNLRTSAEEALAQALRQPSTNPDFWLITGRAAQEVWPLAHSEHKLLHRAKVNPFFEAALKVAPQDLRADVHLDVAQYYLLSAQIDRSGQIVEALQRKTGDLQAARLLVRIRQAQDRDKDALLLLETILKKDPDDVEQHRLAAGIYRDAEDYEHAVPHLEAIIRVAGGSAEDYGELATMLLLSRQPEKALALTQRTRLLFPNNPHFVLVAAEASIELKRLEDAAGYYDKAEALFQATAPERLTDGFYTQWGNLLQTLKRNDDAAKKYQQAISLVPQDNPKRAAAVLNNLGYMWLELNQNIDKAGEFIKRACEFDPASYIYRDSLGWYHFLKADYAASIKVLLEAEKMIDKPKADDAEVIDHIGQAYEKMGDRVKAAEYYQRAHALDGTNAAIKGRLNAVKGK